MSLWKVEEYIEFVANIGRVKREEKCKEKTAM